MICDNNARCIYVRWTVLRVYTTDWWPNAQWCLLYVWSVLGCSSSSSYKQVICGKCETSLIGSCVGKAVLWSRTNAVRTLIRNRHIDRTNQRHKTKRIEWTPATVAIHHTRTIGLYQQIILDTTWMFTRYGVHVYTIHCKSITRKHPESSNPAKDYVLLPTLNW